MNKFKVIEIEDDVLDLPYGMTFDFGANDGLASYLLGYHISHLINVGKRDSSLPFSALDYATNLNHALTLTDNFSDVKFVREAIDDTWQVSLSWVVMYEALGEWSDVDFTVHGIAGSLPLAICVAWLNFYYHPSNQNN